MKVFYSILLVGMTACGLYLCQQLNRATARSISKTEVQYMECINRGQDAQSCAIEQLMLRGLVCKS